MSPERYTTRRATLVTLGVVGGTGLPPSRSRTPAVSGETAAARATPTPPRGCVDVTATDRTGDGTEDVRLENGEMYVQMHGEDLASDFVATAAGNRGGDDVTGPVRIRPQSPISRTESPAAEFGSLGSFDVVEEGGTVGAYRIVREYDLFGDSETDRVPIEVDSTVTLFAGDPFVLLDLTYENVGGKSLRFDQDAADIHDGFQVLVDNDLVGRTDADPTYRFFLPGQGTRSFADVFTFQKFPGTEWATVFDDRDAATYGLLDGHTPPKEWVNIPQDGLDYQLGEFSLAPAETVSYLLVVGVHDGGAGAPDAGRRIHATATDRAAGARPDVVCRIEVVIDVKPGSDPNAINPTSRGVTPVAILGTDDFDPTARVAVDTLRFGPPDVVDAGGGATPARGGGVEDVDRDGDGDLVVPFPTPDTGFDRGDETGMLVGETTDGTPLVGTDSVRIVGPGP